MFAMPENLPTDPADLAGLAGQAREAFDEYKALVEAGENLSDDQIAAMRELAANIAAIDEAHGAAVEAEGERRSEAEALVEQVGAPDDPETVETAETGETDDSGDTTGVDGAEVTDQADTETVVEDRELVAASAGKTPTKRKRQSFGGLSRSDAADEVPAPEVGWRMEPGAPGYKPGLVGFNTLAAGIDSVRPGAKNVRANRPDRGSFAAQTLARLDRDMEVVNDSHALVAAIEKATDERTLDGGSLTAAGGWCAPSETLYDFCDVPTATDLISLPEIAVNRGGVRWPVEPDLSQIFEDFQFFFTEPELEATDGDGDPTAIKECVEVPCPDEFNEIRLSAVGYCVESGILQDQGWPELIEWFLQNLTAEHFRALSRRTVLDMVDGSTSVTIPTDSQIAAGSSVLNSLALMATNLRIKRGLGRDATIEGVAPSWLHEVIRADLANHVGADNKAVTDQQITGWLNERGIALQYVADWQTRDEGKPGHLETLVYPGTVDVLLYPAGTWFRSMSNVIELGTMYPKEQLKVNRYTRLFTEDAIAVGKRCGDSLVVTVPICPSGAIGPRESIACVTGNGGDGGGEG